MCIWVRCVLWGVEHAFYYLNVYMIHELIMITILYTCSPIKSIRYFVLMYIWYFWKDFSCAVFIQSFFCVLLNTLAIVHPSAAVRRRCFHVSSGSVWRSRWVWTDCSRRNGNCTIRPRCIKTGFSSSIENSDVHWLFFIHWKLSWVMVSRMIGRRWQSGPIIFDRAHIIYTLLIWKEI